MGVTIVTEGQVRPGQDATLVDEAVRQIETRAAGNRRHGAARLLQHLENPAGLLLVADWDSREAYWADQREVGGKQPFDALCVGEIERSVFHRLSVYDISCRPTGIDCAMVLSPTPARAVVRAFSEQVLSPAVSALPGFVLRYTYQDVDNPDRFLTLQGWDSQAALERFLRDMAPRLTTSLHGLGATVERFVRFAPRKIFS